MTNRSFILYISAIVIVGQSSSRAEKDFPEPAVIPKPKVGRWSGEYAILANAGRPVSIGENAVETGPLSEGFNLLLQRLRLLGFETSKVESSPVLTVAECSEREMRDRIAESGAEAEIEPARIRQAYSLAIRKDDDGGATVRIEAPQPLGRYYGLLTLVQILRKDVEGNLVVPIGEILDWPEIGVRLAKTSASTNAAEEIERFAAWLPVSKLSHIGLQYHGKNSKSPEPHFPGNVERFCPEFRRKGTLESIVYFCPFRGEVTGGNGAYDFTNEADREAYVGYLRWIMEQDAHGIEVDYNDWPGSREVPIAEVLNLACKTVTEAWPDALILYCPPARGEESYRGMATPQLGKTLSQVPAKVWPLWTGMQTLIKEPLTEEQILEWTKTTGRRPFLWVNRVGPAVPEPFVQEVGGDRPGFVFNGDFLPDDLNRLFEGVHLNAGLQPGYNKITGEFTEDALVYLATTADYLWNPHAWEPEGSLHRGRRFVDVMTPLIRRD